MQSEDYDNIKRYCTHLVRHQMDQDVFLASMLGRLIELEAALVKKSIKEEKKQKEKVNPIKKLFRIE